LRGPNARSRRAVLWSSLLTLAFAAAACAARAPQDTLKPEGPIARQEDNLFRPVFWIAVAVFVLVEGGLVALAVKFRKRSDADAPKQIHGNKRLEIIWTILPAALLAAISIPVVLTIFDVAAKPVGANVVHVNVTGHQWWWEYEYTDFKTPEGGNLKTANELVIPTDRWVYLTMTSADVIHSYWIPKLAGKQDVIPNRTTHLKLRADAPGTYRGQCAEFCAISHANMRARAIAQTPADFDAWVQRQLKPAAMPSNPEVTRIFQSICMNCHTVRGIPNVGGVVGPDLTHLASRTTFAGASFELNAANLFRWIDNPTAMKPLTGFNPKSLDAPSMPDYNLTKTQIDAIVEYLLSLTG
jgi:cytochrome c oxidase subunit II